MTKKRALVLKLYKYGWESAKKHGPHSGITTLFLTELRVTDMEAYESLCQDIACEIIGG